MPMDHRPPDASSRLLAKNPMVHMTRDPRGIRGSMLRSHRGSHPPGRYDMHGEMKRSRPLLQGMDDASGYRWLFEKSVHIPLVIESMIRIETIGIRNNGVDSLAEEFAFEEIHRKNPHYRRGDADSWREELPTELIRDFDARWGRELETPGSRHTW